MSILKHYDHDGLYMHYSFDYSPDSGDFQTHFHDRYELLYVKRGKGRFISEGRIYPLISGAVFIVKRGEMHALEIDSSYPYERMAINFDKRLFEGIDRSGVLFEPFGRENILYTTVAVTESLDKICVIPPDVRGEPLRLRILTHLATALLEIANAYQTEGEPYRDIAILNMSVRLAIKYIHDNLFMHLTLDEIARASFMSKSHISRVFREITGKTVWEYITLKRLIAAHRRLARGEAPAEVAKACGFQYYSTFWRTYKKVFGYSPSQHLKTGSSGDMIVF